MKRDIKGGYLLLFIVLTLVVLFVLGCHKDKDKYKIYIIDDPKDNLNYDETIDRKPFNQKTSDNEAQNNLVVPGYSYFNGFIYSNGFQSYGPVKLTGVIVSKGVVEINGNAVLTYCTDSFDSNIVNFSRKKYYITKYSETPAE